MPSDFSTGIDPQGVLRVCWNPEQVSNKDVRNRVIKLLGTANVKEVWRFRRSFTSGPDDIPGAIAHWRTDD